MLGNSFIETFEKMAADMYPGMVPKGRSSAVQSYLGEKPKILAHINARTPQEHVDTYGALQDEIDSHPIRSRRDDAHVYRTSAISSPPGDGDLSATTPYKPTTLIGRARSIVNGPPPSQPVYSYRQSDDTWSDPRRRRQEGQ